MLRIRTPQLGSLGGTDATASGATLSVTLSLSAGSATAASTAPGAALSHSYSLTAGAASADSTAAGAALGTTFSLTAGTASASSTAAGAALGVAFSLTDGAASGTGNATASGAALGVTFSLTAGAASAASTAAGAALSVTLSLTASSATADSTAPGAALGVTVSLTTGTAESGGSATADGDALTFGLDLIPGYASVPNNFHATGPVRMPRELRTAILAVTRDFDVTVERERRTALQPEELPRVLLYALDTNIEAEFAGASSLRTQRIHVEVVDAVRDGDDFDAVQDRVSALAERIKFALEASPTLNGATLGLMVEDGGEPRAGDLMRQAYESRVLMVSAAYVT